MWFLGLYRLYASIAAGVFFHLMVTPRVWASVLAAAMFRGLWFTVERRIEARAVRRAFALHAGPFKQELGPYGIRLVNRAESDPRIMESLAEVFTPSAAKLRKTVEQLEMMDTLFGAGLRPSGDDYLLHDCKLKYGRHRLAAPKNEA